MQKTFKPKDDRQLKKQILDVLSQHKKPRTTKEITMTLFPQDDQRSRNYLIRRCLEDLNRIRSVKEICMNPDQMNTKWGWIKR